MRLSPARALAAFALALPAVSTLAALPASADATGDIASAIDKTFARVSYHIHLSSTHGTQTDADVAPDGSERVTTSGMQIIMLGTTLYVEHGGTWTKTPMGTSTGEFQQQIRSLFGDHHDFTAQDLGTRVVGGSPLHAYHILNHKTGKTQMAYLDDRGRIVRLETGAATITISKYGEPLNIKAPI